MSRLTGNEIASLMEAYSAVYAPQEFTEEQIWEEVENWVNSLVEEGYDLSEYTWEEMYESYLDEMGQPGGNVPGGNRPISNAPYQSRFARPMNANTVQSLGRAGTVRPQIGGMGGLGAGYRGAELQQAARARASQVGTPRQGTAGGPTTGGNTPIGSTTTVRPTNGAPTQQPPTQKPPTRPSAAPAAKTAPAKPAGSSMDQWAKANPKLAAAAAEKARIRGTQQTDNPLMKDMKSRLPMNSPSVQSPAVSKLGKGNQSLSQNPNAFKAATPTKAIAAAPSTSAAASGSVAPITAKLAATPKPTPVAPSASKPALTSFSTKPGDGKPYKDGPLWEGYDAFDLVLEYLLDNGHVETVDEALYVMMEMDTEVIQDIVEGSYEDRIAANNKKYDRNRQRAAQRAAARNAARDAGKTGSVPGVGYVTPRRERETYTDAAGTERHKTGAKMPKKD